jgi:hypothetical protein
MSRLVLAGSAVVCLMFLNFSALTVEEDKYESKSVGALRSLGAHITFDNKLAGNRAIEVSWGHSGEGPDRTKEFAPIQRLKFLKSIDLHGFGVNDRLLDYLTGLTNLESVELVHTFVTDSGLERLSSLKKLRTLRLCVNYDITDRGIRCLGRLTTLEELAIRESPKITGTGLKNLDRMANLRDLDLGWSNITDDGVKALGSQPALESLVLHGTHITDRSLDYIKAMPKLREVVVEDTEITPQGVRAYQKTRPEVAISFGRGSW